MGLDYREDLTADPVSVRRLQTTLRNTGRAILDIVLPPRCPETGSIVVGRHGLSAQAWAQFYFLSDPCCDHCGLPFDVDLDGPTICAACEAESPYFDRARAALAYDDLSKSLLLRLKHGDRTDLAPLFAGWLTRLSTSMAGTVDFVVPVPLHRTRLMRRRFNQSALLALGMGKINGARTPVDLLQRIRKTPSQGHLSKLARHRNVRGAFAVRDKYRRSIAGKEILLVDDVFTTGATVNECARVLKRAGAARVNVATVARVISPRN